MKKKITALLLCGALLAGVLTGCGQGAEEKEGTDSVNVSESVSTPETEGGESQATQGESEAASDPGELTIADISSMELVSRMKLGWNLGNTLDSTGKVGEAAERAWGNPTTKQEMIDAILDKGFNVIRIPVSWGNQMAGAPTYNVLPAWMDRVQEVVDYAYGRGAYVILNIHHEDWHFPSEENEEAASEQLAALWTQIAERFKDYDEHLIFEGMNEPRKIGTSVEWNGGDEEGQRVVNHLCQVFVDAVRATGGNNTLRHLMVPSYAASSSDAALKALQLPDDEKLIVSVHAYTPYDFALNTAGTSQWNNDTRDIDHLMGLLKELFIDKGVPVIIGEFGAMNKDNEAERVKWVQYYLTKAREIGVPCIWWDNGAFTGDGENFGIFDRRKLEFPYPDLLDAMLKSSGAVEE